MRGISRVVGGVFALALAGAPLVLAQSTEILPPANAAVYGGVGNFVPMGASLGGAYQVLYDTNQLVGLQVGARITSIRLRQANTANAPWPPAASVCADYEIRIGTSSRTAATMSTTYADNISGAVLVRDGALNLAANAYPGGPATGSTPEDWGPVITFTTPYTYSGGPLVLEFRSSGSPTIASFAEAVGPFTGAAGMGNTPVSTDTNGFEASPLVVRLGIEPAATEVVTVPNANDTVAGTTGNFIPFAAVSGGRQMTLYAADQLADIPAGSLIMGLQLRQRNTETTPWPASAFTASDYEIWLCRSALTPATVSATFADNILDPVRVRDGARDFALNEFPGGAATGTTPEAWGPLIAFDTPYLYTGGVLGLEFRTTGGGPSPSQFADVVNNGATAAGLASTTSPTNPTGGLNGALIARFTYVPPVESPFGNGVTKVYAINNYADTLGSSSQSAYSFSSGIANQAVFAPSPFQTIGPGTLLTALSMRNSADVAWPPIPTASDYSIELSQSQNGPATLSTTIANNAGPDKTIVRSGVLNVPTGAMAPAPVGKTAPYTWEIPFSVPYPYRSGSLLNVVRSSGFVTTGSVDAVSVLDPANGVESRGFFGFGAAAGTTPFDTNVPVMRYSADAQVMVPNSLKDGVGFNGSYNAVAPTSSNEAVLQVLLGASELSYIPVGGLITSLSLVANSSQAAWPGATGAAADDLNVEISSAANQPESMSRTFADNVGADASIVRSGPIAWEPGALPAGSTGRFGATITFDRAFVYKGGPLCITIRHAPVINGGPTLRTAGPATATRAASSAGNKAATTGSLFGVSGPAIQLGYIPSGVSPKNVLAADGNGGRFAFAGTRAYQMIYDANQVGVPVGATINGVSFRLENDVASAFPDADLTLDRFDITMSSATNSAATMSDTFASNEGADVTTVRSGPLTIPAASYPPNADGGRRFGLFIPFTRPFVYKGGPITMLLRNGNASGANANFNVDAHTVGANGTRDTTSADAVSGANVSNALVARFAFTDDAFCPWDLNNDGVVTDDDFQVFVLAYNILDCADPTMPLGCPSDFTFDRIVNDDDFLPFVQAYNDLLCP